MKARFHSLVVPKTARYAVMGELDETTREVWLLCHGYGQLAAEFLRSASVLAGDGRVLVAPEGLSRFYHDDHQRVGASWMTKEDREREMDDYIRYLDLLYDQLFELVERDSVRLVVLGFSQGVATAARWVARGKASVDHLVMWGAATPPELDDELTLAPIGASRVTLVAGSHDELFPDATREENRERLTRHGVVFTELGFDGGHRLDNETLLSLAEIRQE